MMILAKRTQDWHDTVQIAYSHFWNLHSSNYQATHLAMSFSNAHSNWRRLIKNANRSNIISELCVQYICTKALCLLFLIIMEKLISYLIQQPMNNIKTPGQPSKGFSEYITWVIFKCFWLCYIITCRNFHFSFKS